MNARSRLGQRFVAGSLIGTLGGLIGLGEAEFRLPVLIGLSGVMLSEAWLGWRDDSSPLFQVGPMRFVVGLVAGFTIGVLAALLGVAGGELLIFTILLMYGLDIKLGGSLSLIRYQFHDF